MLSKIKLEEDYIMKTNLKKIVIVLVIIAIIAGVITYFINKNKNIKERAYIYKK